MRKVVRTIALLLLVVSASFCSDTRPQNSRPASVSADSTTTAPKITRTEFDALVKTVKEQEAEIAALRNAFEESRDGGFFGGGFLLLILAGLGYYAYRNSDRLKKELERVKDKLGNSSDVTVPQATVPTAPAGPQPPARPQAVDPVQDAGKKSPPAQDAYHHPNVSSQAHEASRRTPAQSSPVQDRQPLPQQPAYQPPAAASGPPKTEERLYAEQPANGVFLTNRIAAVPDNFSAYSLSPSPEGQQGTYDVMDDPEVQQQILNSRASYSQAIEFRGEGNYIVNTTPGTLNKEDGGWRIIDRIVVQLG